MSRVSLRPPLLLVFLSSLLVLIFSIFAGFSGRSVHTQVDLVPIPDFPHSVVSIALGQDHSLALTSSGHVFSWGLNRFSVLGYQVDTPALGSKFQSAPEEPIQSTPRRVVGTLKKEKVLGVAASRCSSACWTSDSVWTWGYNNGHLGEFLPCQTAARCTPVSDMSRWSPPQATTLAPTQPRVYPGRSLLSRKPSSVSRLPTTRLSVFSRRTRSFVRFACSPFGSPSRSLTGIISCPEGFYRGGSTKVNFPTSPFFAESAIYRPPEFRKRSEVVKVTASGITFACLTSLGDVFTFALASPTEVDRDAAANGAPRERGVQIKPQRAWALRKKFTAVKDGESGRLFLRVIQSC